MTLLSYRGTRGEDLYFFPMSAHTCLPIPESVQQHRSTRRAWLPYALVLAGVVAAFGVEHALRPVPGFPYDDPYIDLHSAQVLHTGSDPNYPGVPALFGVTSAPFGGLIYVLLFILRPLQALEVSCWIGVLFYALGLVHLARVFKFDKYRQSLFLFVGLATAPIPIHWLNGLETSCALAAVTWTLAFAAGDRRNWIAAAFVAGLSASLRPDLLIFAVLTVMLLAWQTLREFSDAGESTIQITWLVLAAILPLVLCGFWYFHLTGSPFPLTAIAKRYFFAEDHWALARRLNAEMGEAALFLAAIGPLAMTFLRMHRFRLGKVLLAVWVLFLGAFFFEFPGELGVNEFRYPVVLIPTLLWTLGMMLKNEHLLERRQAERVLYGSAIYAALLLPVCVWFYTGERTFFETGPRQVTIWCQQHLAPGTPILVHDAGFLAYSTNLRTIDFVGLKTPSAIPLNRRYTWPSAGAGRALTVDKMAHDSGARYLVLNSHWWPIASLTTDMRSLGWKLELVHAAGAFQIFRITPAVK